MAVTGAYGSATVVSSTATGATIAAVSTETGAVISGALQGPPGPVGTAPSLLAIAAQTISANTAVALVNGQLVPAQSGTASQAGNVVGIAINGGQAGTSIAIQQSGEMSLSSWSWTMGLPIFVGPNGPLTQTPPTAGFSQVVGVPLSATSISIGLESPILIV